MRKSNYSGKYESESYYIGLIRAAVEEFQAKHGGFGDVVVVATHISAEDYTAQGHAVSALDGVVMEIERIANRKLGEQEAREARQEALWARYDRDEISFEQWEAEYIFSF